MPSIRISVPKIKLIFDSLYSKYKSFIIYLAAEILIAANGEYIQLNTRCEWEPYRLSNGAHPSTPSAKLMHVI